ncbi:hypothetical protein CYVG_00234 [Cyanophage S-SSM6a]|jgi:hypothetical protein|uniref:Uncharacterized protein n=1 Tax=Synechococcus phage S-SSM7 TaxID=445686 RepID=E3SKX3_9CAUD|nr:hypothetical protein SSSM7_055 [Synechococcus phage S-SSM7]ADO98121.1 hypothetical protein SSSM7_055 [Synechococcus phage S-SSM7]AGH07677.1 hypothetical protein CYVG_00234 [Cyanophage S-SSM6a]|tara:strand:- start:320 stop:577 length:258 start_codon:yes stop_codon:yes gene_type:complete
MTLSQETLEKLADALVLEVIHHINTNPKAHNALYELVSDAICEKLGNKNGDGTCSFDGSKLVPAVVDKLQIMIVPRAMPSDPATL